jgi:hypothetical protein
MSPREIEQRVIATLRGATVAQRIGMDALRQEVGCGTRELTTMIKRLRMQGKIEWDCLLLSESMRAEVDAEAKPEADVAQQVREEAQLRGERRRTARGTGTVRRVLDGATALTLVEQVQSALVAEPNDLIRTVKRKHPQLWQRIVQLGRDVGEHPALALYRAIETGLDVLDADLAEERAA